MEGGNSKIIVGYITGLISHKRENDFALTNFGRFSDFTFLIFLIFNPKQL